MSVLKRFQEQLRFTNLLDFFHLTPFLITNFRLFCPHFLLNEYTNLLLLELFRLHKMFVAPLFRLLEDDEVELVEDDNPAYVMLVTGRFDPVTN